MTFLAGCAVGAGSVLAAQIAVVAAILWSAPKVWRWAKRQWAEAWDLQ